MTVSEQIGESRPLAGVAWMLGSGLCFVAVTGIVRYLGTDLPAAQSAFLRFGWGVLLLVPVLGTMGRLRLPPGALRLVLWRGVAHTGAVMAWFYAMARLPVAEVTAIGYLNPVLVTVGAALLFGERLRWPRLVAIAVALVGALIVLRPGLREVSSGHLSQLAAAGCFAVSYLFAKRLSQMLSAGVVVALMSVTVTLGLVPFAVWSWVPVSLGQLLWLGLVAVFATAGHWSMTQAFQAAPMAVTQPVIFLQLVWATLLGAVVFDERVDPYVLLGGAVIIGAISFITWREHIVRRRVVTPAATDL